MKPKSGTTRPQQQLAEFIKLIDQHLDDLLQGRVSEMHEIERFAELMFIHPTHLSNLIKELTGSSPCGIFQTKLIGVAQQLLADPALPIGHIAIILTFEPSQFTKWFKRLTGVTPKSYRLSIRNLTPVKN
jgi:AraC-like DNA-binding protein